MDVAAARGLGCCGRPRVALVVGMVAWWSAVEMARSVTPLLIKVTIPSEEVIQHILKPQNSPAIRAVQIQSIFPAHSQGVEGVEILRISVAKIKRP